MTEENTNVTVGDEIIDLASLAGVDMSGVSEVRSMILPAGQYLFKILDAKLESREVSDRSDSAEEGAKINKPVVDFELEVSDCMALVKDDLDPGSVIGRKHHNSFYINDLAMDLGRVQAFLTDIGIPGNKALNELLVEAHGVEFVTDITNTKNRDNPDIIYANLKNTLTMAKFQEAQASE